MGVLHHHNGLNENNQGCKRPPSIQEIACLDCHKCFIWNCGYSFRIAPNPLWYEQGALCPYEHCIENSPHGDQFGCPVFGHSCPGGSSELFHCTSNFYKLEKQLALRIESGKNWYGDKKSSLNESYSNADLPDKYFEDSLAECEKAVLVEPLNSGYHFCKGYALQNLCRSQEAIKEFEIAIE
jgi:hypothetical protein